jgi:hypothetical protein
MHAVALRTHARALAAAGATPAAVATALGLPSSTVHRWLTTTTVTDLRAPAPCFVCERTDLCAESAAAYSYLLGQYLGDGHLVTQARIPVLRIYACTDYPDIIAMIGEAVGVVRGVRPGLVRLASARALAVQSYWLHWPCVIPQCGPGRKHERAIALTPWQEEIVGLHPWPFLRGLIHSDGCRATNRVIAKGKQYEYPRYFFANESTDILAIAGRTLDSVGVAWRYNRPNSISIARRASVAILDEHIGPKT